MPRPVSRERREGPPVEEEASGTLASTASWALGPAPQAEAGPPPLPSWLAARPRTPPVCQQQPPRSSDLHGLGSLSACHEDEVLDTSEDQVLQETLRLQDLGLGRIPAPEKAVAEDGPHARSKMRTLERSLSKMRALERSLKTGHLPSATSRCIRCGADHPDSLCRDLHEFLQKQKIPKYKKLPSVEVRFKVRSISDLDSKTGTFLADFLLDLHWVDPGLERDTHYTEDYQSQTLQLFPAFESHIFNPEVVLDNAVEELSPLQTSDSFPKIQAETPEGLWLRRRVHFKGLLACSSITYVNFPLDTHALSISVKLSQWNGLTAKVVSPTPELREVRGGRKDSQKQEAWPGHRVRQECIHLGDLNFVAWGVYSQTGVETSEGNREDKYELIMVLRRSFRRHFFTFFILSMAVLSGSTSLFCPLSIDVLAGRLSINVTVLLSMVAFSVQRPSAIEAVPYDTIHDIFVQVCTLLTASLSLCNLATHLACFEITEGCTECVREDLAMCMEGSCGSKVIDCYFFYTLLALLVIIDLGLLLWARRVRHSEIWSFRARCKDLPPGAQSGCERSCSECCQRLRAKSGRLRPYFDCRAGLQRLCSACCAGCAGRARKVRVERVESRWASARRNNVKSKPKEPREGVPCFFLYEKSTFNPVKGGLSELMLVEWQEAVAMAMLKDRASLLPIRRCISRYSRTSAGSNGLSRRLAQPAVLEGEQTHYLDMGGAEVGLYRYCHLPDAPPLEQIVCHAAAKLEWPGLKEVLCEDQERAKTLRESLVTYLVEETREAWKQGDGKGKAASGTKHLLVGITGEMAALLEEDTRLAGRVEQFIEQLEDDLCGAASKQWEIYYFLLPKEDEAFYERIAIGWLMEHTDLKLADTFAKEPKLEAYMRQQVTSWALLSGRKSIGQMEQDEFIERFMPLSRQPTFELRAWEALEWFRVMDEDGSGTITVSEMLNCMLESEDLLQAVIRHRLFVGTLAGGPRSVQLTVAEPDPEKEGEVLLHSAKVGTRTPVLLGLFKPEAHVTKEMLLRWENLLLSIIDNSPAEMEELKAQHYSLRDNELHEWPSALRGIFVGISGMFYAARDAGITERLITKQDCLAALAAALDSELGTRGADNEKKLQSHQQKVANLAMAHALVGKILHDDAWLYFRRSWQMGQSFFIATWSLGVFLNGKRKDGNQAGAFTRVRSRLDEAVDAVEVVQEEKEKQKTWARRLSAALRLSALARRTPSSGTVD